MKRRVRPLLAVSSVALFALILSGCDAGSRQAPDEGADAPVGQAQQASTSVTDNLNVIQGSTSGCTAASGFDSAYASGVIDTQLDQGTPNMPEGATITSMGTGPDASGNLQYSLVQFSLAGLPSGSALAALHASSVRINNAYMLLTLTSEATSTGTVNVHQVTSPWDPTATWNSAPTWISTPAASFEVPSGTLANDELPPAINMPSLVTAWAAGAPNYGVLLEEGVPPTSTGPSASFWRSDDGDYWYRPELTVIYTLRCSAGYADCNGDACDGCEASVTSDPNNCGGCGAVCALANAVPQCSGGACAIASCDAGYYDCDGNPANGCEATSCANGQQCTSNAGCQSGLCAGGVCVAPADCAAGTSDNCVLAYTTSGGTSGACASGYGAGSCSFSCYNGVWTQVTDTCAPAACAAGAEDGDCDLSATDSGGTSGACAPGLGAGSCSYSCTNGVWTEVTDTCAPAACTAATESGNCNVGATNSGGTSGSCAPGFGAGSCSYACTNGAWTQVTDTCAPAPCTAATENGNCNVGATGSGASSGSCASGFGAGSCSFACANGVWTQVADTCAPAACAAATESGNCNVGATNSGGTSGACASGYGAGSCSYACANGVWTQVADTCAPASCPATQSGNVCVSWTQAAGTVIDGVELPEGVTIHATGSTSPLVPGGNAIVIHQAQTPTLYGGNDGNGNGCLDRGGSNGGFGDYVTAPNPSNNNGANNFTLTFAGAPTTVSFRMLDNGDLDADGASSNSVLATAYDAGGDVVATQSFGPWAVPTGTSGDACSAADGNVDPGNWVFTLTSTGNPIARVEIQASSKDANGTVLTETSDPNMAFTDLCFGAGTANADCTLSATNSGGTSGACASGYTGACSYSCANGTWTQVSDSCAAECQAGTEGGDCDVTLTDSGNTSGACAPGLGAGSCSYSCTDGVWTQVADTCAPAACAAATENGNCDLGATNSGGTSGACAPGFGAGSCSYACTNGTWTEVADTCAPAACEAGTENGDCNVGATSSGGTSGACAGGFGAGSCSYACTNGTWSVVTDTCAPAACAAGTENGNCNVGATNSGGTSGSCASGFGAGSCSYACTNGVWTQVADTCAPAACAAATENGNCNVSATNSGGASGTCASGFGAGSCSYACTNGTWNQVTDTCAPASCAAQTDNHCVLAATNSGSTDTGSCASGYTGACSFSCSNGAWAQVTNTCVAQCAAATENGNCNVSTTNSGGASGTCASGFGAGSCSFSCANGVWTQVSDTCAAAQCAAGTENGNCTVSATNSGSTSGACASGFGAGSCSYACTNGVWTQVTDTCAPAACTAQTDNHCVLTTTNSGSTDTGSCAGGYTGACSFSCSNGAWTQLTDTCAAQCAAATENGNCTVSLTNSGGTSGSCVGGDTGSCSFSCTNGAWTQVTDTCAQGCTISGTTYAAGTVNPSNSCQACQPSLSTTAFTNIATGGNTSTCLASSGFVCNGSGACVSDCFIGGALVTFGTYNPTDGCQFCVPTTSTTSYTAVTNGTNTATCLASNGDVCEGGNCVCNSTGGLVNCSGVCVSESNDPNNCGSCGHKCATGQVCASGTCSTAFVTSKIAVGATFACAVVNGGEVYCWGATSTYGSNPVYLGDGSTAGSTTPVQVTGITTAVSVFAAAFNACALLSSGEVECWGDNVSGQLGNGTTTNETSPVAVTGLSNAIAVAGNTYPGGPSFSCAVESTGGVECWGDNSEGELGNNTTTSSLTPVTVSGLTNAIAIATGADFACALKQGGTVVCWGDEAGGALGNGVSSGFSATPVAVSGVTNAVGISADYESACAVLSNGEVTCWGYNGNDDLGDNSTSSSLTPVTVYQLTDGTAIVACDGSSVSTTCAATTAGTAYCWGDNTSGQLGNQTTTSSDVPVQVKGLSGAVQISVGGGAGTGQASACALLSDGAVECWGSNAYGQLGNGTNTSSLSPVTVIDL